MQRLKKLFRSALHFGKTKIAERVDEINAGLEEENVPQVLLNSGVLVLIGGTGLFLSAVLVQFIVKNMHLFIIGIFVAAALYSAILKFLGVDIDDGNSADSTTVELAEQEAQEVHEELRELVYNALAEAAEYTPLQRPRDTYSIETSREKPYRMDGAMAVHQFEADFNRTLDRSKLDSLSCDIQRRINKHAKRFPLLMHNGHPPVLYDVKDNGNFLVLFTRRITTAKSRPGSAPALGASTDKSGWTTRAINEPASFYGRPLCGWKFSQHYSHSRGDDDPGWWNRIGQDPSRRPPGCGTRLHPRGAGLDY